MLLQRGGCGVCGWERASKTRERARPGRGGVRENDARDRRWQHRKGSWTQAAGGGAVVARHPHALDVVKVRPPVVPPLHNDLPLPQLHHACPHGARLAGVPWPGQGQQPLSSKGVPEGQESARATAPPAVGEGRWRAVPQKPQTGVGAWMLRRIGGGGGEGGSQ
jgi:hypothetical protein